MSAGSDMNGDSGGGDDRILAGEYALGLLDAAETQAFETRLAAEPDLRAIYADWAEALVAMTDPVAPEPPPAAVWAAIRSQLFPDAAAAAPVRTRWRWGWWAGAGLAAAVALALLVDRTPQVPPDPGVPALTARLISDAGPLALAAVYDPGDGALRLSREAGAPAPQGRAQELWLIAETLDAPVSLGVLGDGPAIAVAIPDDLKPLLAGATLAVSDEPAGGSPTGGPTGAVLAAGQITSL